MDCGLFHLMEDFILKEVDYSQKHGYTSRAKRYMRRKLNRELAPFVEDQQDKVDQVDKESDTESETELDKIRFNESILISSKNLDICIGITYICILVTFYGSIIYITQAYDSKTCKQ
jgi:hypothetical protein